MKRIFSLADIFTDQVRRANHESDSDTRNVLIGVTVVLAIGLVIFIWAYFHFRKKSNAQDKKRLSQFAKSISPQEGASSTGGQSSNNHQRRRKRRRVREHRPSNPTLEKTGGLPPPRPDNQPPKY